MKPTVFTIILLFFSYTNFGQEILEGIPDSLLKNSHMVILEDNYDFTILDNEKTITEVTTSYIVLKKSSNVPWMLSIFYDDFVKVSKAKVRIYDSNNKLIKKYKTSDFKKQMLTYGSVAVDNGIRFLPIPEITPPYKVEFYYKKKSKNSMFYPNWESVDEYQSAVTSGLTVYDKTKSNLRYKSFNIGDPVIENEKDYIKYQWSIRNRKAIKYEPFNNRFEDYFPKVFLSPKDFKVQGYEGNMTNWKSAGQWINLLNEGRNSFTVSQKKQIQKIVNKDDTDIEKVKKIYKFLQNNTRYVSIQLGIGGWQPFESGFVYDKKYGDCKALSFFTKSMLEEVGIPSYYTLVRAGAEAQDVFSDFTNLRFNHAFLMVPLDSDTLWLECTSQKSPCGYLGSFTDDRNVLVIKEDGGELVRSKQYKSSENINSVNVDIKLNSDGSAIVELTDSMVGLATDKSYYSYIVERSNSDKKKWLNNNIVSGHMGLSSFDIKAFIMNPIEDKVVPESSFEILVDAKDYAIKAGENLIIKPLIFNKMPYDRITDKIRKHNIYIKRAFKLLDSIKIEIPEDYNLQYFPKIIDVKSDYGHYNTSFKIEDKTIVMTREVEIFDGEYDKSEFELFKSFFNSIIDNDKKRLVLEKSK